MYFDFPNFLIIELTELDIYYFKIFFLIENSKLNIFEYLYKKTNDFLTNEVKQYGLDKINATKKIIMANYNTSDRSSQSLIIESANAITFFSKISLICMARENNFYIANLNLLNVYKGLCNEIRQYYVLILQKITGKRRIYKYDQELKKKEDEYKSKYLILKGFLPQLIQFFKTIGLTFENPFDFDSLILKIREADDNYKQIMNEILEFDFFLKTIVPKYKNNVNDFVPKLSDIAILTNCENIISSDNILLKQPYTSHEIKNRWLKDKLFDNMDYNVKDDFIDYLNILIEYNIFENYVPNYDIDELQSLIFKLNIYKDKDILKYGKTGDSIFGAITIAFNGTLISNNKYSSNPYAIGQPGTLFEGYFSSENLRKAVADNFNIDDYEFFKTIPGISYPKPNSINKFLFEGSKFIGDNIDKIKDIMEISEEDNGSFGVPEIIIPILCKIFKIHIRVLSEFSKNKQPRKGDIVYVITENKRRLKQPYMGIITDIKEVADKKMKTSTTLYSIKNINTLTTNDFKINHFHYLNESNYKFDCIIDNITKRYFENVGLSIDELESYPNIFLIEKKNSEFSYYELLYFQNKKIDIAEDDESIHDESSIPMDYFIDETNIYPIIGVINSDTGLNAQIQRIQDSGTQLLDANINIQKCVEKSVSEKKNVDFFRRNGNKVAFIPEALYGFDVAKNIGDGNCALTSVLLCIYENYQKFFTVPDDDNPNFCIDRSIRRSEIGKILRRVLSKHFQNLNDRGNMGIFRGLSVPDIEDILTQLNSFNVINDDYGYLTDEIFQIFANYFGFNILIYSAPSNNFKYYVVGGSIENFLRQNGEIKWLIIYQSINHFSPFFKINNNGEYIFQFSNKIINYILNKISVHQLDFSSGIVELKDAFQQLIDSGAIQPIEESEQNSPLLPNSNKSFVFIFDNNDSLDEKIIIMLKKIYEINCEYDNFGVEPSIEEPLEEIPKQVKRKGKVKKIEIESKDKKSKDKKSKVKYEINPKQPYFLRSQNKKGVKKGGFEDESYEDESEQDESYEDESEQDESEQDIEGGGEMQIEVQEGGDDSLVPKSSYFNVYNSNQYTSDESKLSYYVIIDIELYPGKDGIPASQRAVLSCQSRYEKIRQAYSNLFGLEYRPNEFISSIYTPPPKKSKGSENINDTRRNISRNYPNYYTRRRYPRRL
jgi:hypothetical protein